MTSVEDLYEGMCPHYHLFVEDWDGRSCGMGPRAETQAFSARVGAVTRASPGAALSQAGLRDLRWLEPAASGFYQPIVAARSA